MVSARECWLWALQCASPADAPILPGVLSRGCSGSRSRGLWSRCCRGTAKAAILGFAKGSVRGGRDRLCLFSPFTWQIHCLVSGLGSTRCGFFRADRGTDTAAIWFWGIRCCKCQCNVYWGLATSVSCLWWASWGCVKCGWEIKKRIDWPVEREDFRSKGKLDERFSSSHTQPQCRGLPFFPDLHTEVSRSWEKRLSYRVYSTQSITLFRYIK